MIHAVAVIAVALGAVTKFHIGIVRVRNAAYRTFMQVAVLFLGSSDSFDLPLILPEVSGIGADPISRPLLPTPQQIGQIVPEKYKIIQNAYNGHES